MSNRKKALIWLVVIWGIGLLVKAFLSPKIGTWILYLAGLFLVAWFIEEVIKTLEIDKMCKSIDRRFRRIEHPLGLLDDTNEEYMTSKPVSYRIELVLMPQWEEILKKLADQNKQKPKEFIDEIFKDEKLNLNDEYEKNAGLFNKWFRFFIFQDGVSGMQQIWSDYHKTFLDEIKVEGQVFAGLDILSVLSKHSDKSKYSDKLVSKPLALTPSSAYFEISEFKSHVLSSIPYRDIIRLLRYIGKNTGLGTQYAIKRFPDELKKELEKYKIVYKIETPSLDEHVIDENFNGSVSEYNNKSKWAKDKDVELYDQQVESHIFATQYYSLSISLETFEPPRQPVFQA